MYRRYDPQIKRTLSFRVADVAMDGERFYPMDEQPARERLLEMAGPQAEQESYLRRQLDSTYCYPVISSLTTSRSAILSSTGRRIVRHYRWQPFDRGPAVLVGRELARRAVHP